MLSYMKLMGVVARRKLSFSPVHVHNYDVDAGLGKIKRKKENLGGKAKVLWGQSILTG